MNRTPVNVYLAATFFCYILFKDLYREVPITLLYFNETHIIR